jgi:uncharacterized protein (TIGR02646 family)
MIRLQRPALVDAIPDAKVRAALAERRHGAASLSPRDAKITSRWDSFVGEKGRDRAVGHAVCAAVRAYCRAKCAYCEAPEAMTIDHVWPKSEHPARMFDWDNLLAACRDCNTSKRSSFPLDERGVPLLIDPTRVDPLNHFRWNHVTGECVHDPQDPHAHHTFQAFDLDRLKRERMEKLLNLRFLLTQALGSVEDRSALHQRLRGAGRRSPLPVHRTIVPPVSPKRPRATARGSRPRRHPRHPPLGGAVAAAPRQRRVAAVGGSRDELLTRALGHFG